MNKEITIEKLEHYFLITKQALEKAKLAFDPERLEQAQDFFNMANNYYNDAHFFYNSKNDLVLAFAALNYAHGWLDAGARIRLFKVNDSRLFTVDEEI
jgi:uncharacterized protein